MNEMRIETIRYQETEGGPSKTGVIINEGMGPILDLEGQVVPEVWDYQRTLRQVMTVEEEKE